jgi:hypothetical protein
MVTLPKFKLAGLAPRRKVAATPVPLTGIAKGEPGALSVSETDPLTSPPEVGEKTTLNEVLLPAATDAGSERPLMLKPAPVTLAAETVSVAVPLFVRVIVWELLVPVVTFPKTAVVGLAEICGCVAVPLMAIVRGEPVALLVTEMLPLALPAVVGANWAVNDALPPALIVTGTMRPLIVNPAPVALAAEIVTVADPEFVNVIDWDPLLPTRTLPKLTLDGFAERVACVPVPVRAIEAGEPGALLASETLPVALPAIVGAN